MTATRLDSPSADDRLTRLEARQRELYGLLTELRSSHAPRERIRELILAIDAHDARVEAARALPPAPPVSELIRTQLRLAPPAHLRGPEPAPPAPVDDEKPSVPLTRILIVGAALVAAAAVVGVLAAGRGSSAPTADAAVRLRTVPLAVPPASSVAPAAASVPVRLQTHLATTPCPSSGARTALRWTWTLPSGYDGQPATIEATGQGLAGSYQRTVAGGRVALTYTSPCQAPGATWSVSLDSVGTTPARLTSVEQAP